jgi:chromosome segregation ATPase
MDNDNPQETLPILNGTPDANQDVLELRKRLNLIEHSYQNLVDNQNESANKENEELVQENAKLKDKVDMQNRVIADYTMINQKLEMELNESRENERDLKEKIDTLKIEVDAFKTKASDADKAKSTSTPGLTPAKSNTITITLEELLRWEKKSKDLTAQVRGLEKQIKTLEMQNSNLKIELEDRSRTLNHKQTKQDITMEVFEEKSRALQSILDATLKQKESMEFKIKSLEDQNMNLKVDYQAKDEEVKTIRQAAKDKFELERRYTEMMLQFENHKARSAKFEEERMKLESKTKIIEQLEIHKEQLEIELAQARSDIDTLQEQVTGLRKDYETAQIGIIEEQSQNKKLTEALEEKAENIELLSKEVSDLKAVIEDLNVEKSIFIKKSQTEIKELKSALHNDKGKWDHLIEDKSKLEIELKTLQATLKSNPTIAQTVTVDKKDNNKLPFSLDSKQEKVIMEALSNRIQMLEKELIALRNNYKALETKCATCEKIISIKTMLINAFLTECADKLPMASEWVEKLDRDDTQFVKSLSQCNMDDLQMIAEKTFMENVRLKKDLTMLGSELNKVIRTAKN